MLCSICKKTINDNHYVKIFWWNGIESVETVMCRDCYDQNPEKVSDLINNHGGFVYRFGSDQLYM